MLYAGGGLISIGGGEGLWLYINKVLIVESISSAEMLMKQCYTVDLSEARENGMLLSLSFIEFFYQLPLILTALLHVA